MTTPLITIQPALDAKNVWVALLLECDAPLDGQTLEHLLFDLNLAGVLQSLPCALPADPCRIAPALARRLPRSRLVLRFPVALAADRAIHPDLTRLQDSGFGLMASGFPAADAILFPGLHSLAVPCPGPGYTLPASCSERLHKLPGPHLALGVTDSVCPEFSKFHWLGGGLAGHIPPPASDPNSQSLLLRLLTLVIADADVDALEILIRRDTHLSYSLLKLVNSVAFVPSRQIDSFAQAIAILGRRQLQRWLQLLLYVRPKGCDVANPLLPRAALRASLMESLSKRLGLPRDVQEQAFMAGMFSLLGLLLRMPFEQLLPPLSLPGAVVQALTDRAGPIGSLLAAVEAGEGNSLSALDGALAAAGVSQTVWAAALIEAAAWAAQISKEA